MALHQVKSAESFAETAESYNGWTVYFTDSKSFIDKTLRVLGGLSQTTRNARFRQDDSRRQTISDSQFQDVAPAPFPVFICAWHPGFDPTDPANKGASHGICPACLAKVNADLDRREAAIA